MKIMPLIRFALAYGQLDECSWEIVIAFARLTNFGIIALDKRKVGLLQPSREGMFVVTD